MKKSSPLSKQINLSCVEEGQLITASSHIEAAFLLNESSKVKLFQFLFSRLDTVELLQLSNAVGNLMHQAKWVDLTVHSNGDTWELKYKRKDTPV